VMEINVYCEIFIENVLIMKYFEIARFDV